MKLLHTSDWHLGNQFSETEKRNEEFGKVLDWILELSRSEQIDLLLIAGDLFDTRNPPVDALSLFYRFVGRLTKTGCRHLIVVGGNHDSAGRINAPVGFFDVYDKMDIHMIGGVDPEDPAREVITLSDENSMPEAIVCAVPYVHEKFLRTVQPGESQEEKSAKMREGLKKHYDDVGALAEAERARIKKELGKDVPLIVTGHLFIRGSEKYRSADDGVRDLPLGGLESAGLDVFPESADYVALGHIHRGYPIENHEHIRYSGSIVPIGFDELAYEKIVCLAEFDDRGASVREIEIPRFRLMKNITGTTTQEILSALDAFEAECGGRSGYFKVTNTGEYVPELHQQVSRHLDGKNLVCCGTFNKNSRLSEGMISVSEGESLDELTEMDVFNRRMEEKKVEEERRQNFRNLLLELILEIDEEETEKGE